MCSITWSHLHRGGLALCFNRDEKHTRPLGLPPQVWNAGGFLAPRDAAGGGTWLAVRQDGAVFALLNHYPAGFMPAAAGPSRGALIPSLAVTDELPSLQVIRHYILPGMNPFRLLWLTPADACAQVFTWDGRCLKHRRLVSQVAGMLTSSSWNTAAVVVSRHAAFRRWLKNHSEPKLEDIEVFHREVQHPRGSAWAVCMNRDNSRTVSLNTLLVMSGQARLTHEHRDFGSSGFCGQVSSMSLPIHVINAAHS